jgi:hypothetical protein
MIEPKDMDPDQLRDEALRLLDLITVEFKTDPMSVQCFDLGTVNRAIAVVEEYRNRERHSLLQLGASERR